MELVVIGAPTSAGAHHAGPELAPDALRAHGFIDRLQAGGLRVRDAGDVEGAAFRPDAVDSRARNVGAVVQVARAVAGAVADARRRGEVPIILGGDCTVTVGVVAGLQRAHDDVRVAYFDGDADLVAPHKGGSGILDATGVAHLLGIATTELASIGEPLREDQLALLGYDPTDPDSFSAEELAARPGLHHISGEELQEDPVALARRVVDGLSGPDVVLAVHFDVDAVDSADLPLANYPHYGAGVPLEVAGEVLKELVASPAVGAVCLTEVNPTHDPQGEQLDRYVATITGALKYMHSG
jgi:arginase